MIYLDYAATTPMFGELNSTIAEYNTTKFFNPSVLYMPQKQKSDIRAAKQVIADKLGAAHSEMIITSGATESNNLAITGVMAKAKGALVISAGEHACVYNTAMALRLSGVEVIVLPLNAGGDVNIASLEELLRSRGDNISMLSIIHASNEIGVINDIRQISGLIKKYNSKIVFHSDGVQAFCKCDTLNLGVDLYSISGHKFGAPKGIGALYVRKGTKLSPLILGGGQEGGLRSGTENVSGLMAMSQATYLCCERFDNEQLLQLKQYIITEITANISDSIVNCPDSHSTMPHIVSLSFPKMNAETLMHSLEARGVFVGLGSACSSNAKGNRVLAELGYNKEQLKGTIRISMGWETTASDIATAVREIIQSVKELKKYAKR